MQNLFVSENEEFNVKFSVATNEKGIIFCDLNRKSLIESFGSDIEGFEIKDYEAIFRKPSFGDSLELYSSIFSIAGEDVNFNPVQARFNKIVALIKSWDLKGTKEKPTEEEIRQLHPTIAALIGIVIDQETGSLFG